jgi:hypothetical protein
MKLSMGVNTIPSLSAGLGMKNLHAGLEHAEAPGGVSPEALAPDSSAAPGAATANAVPAFITPASLITVSGGTAAVTLLWQVAKLLAGARAESPWVPFGISLLIGALIYVLSIQDAKVKASTSEKIVGIFVGFMNSMVLFAAAVGILGKSQ